MRACTYGAFCNDNNSLPLAHGTVLVDNLAHVIGPRFGRRRFGDEYEVGSSRDTSHQSEPTAMPAHDFNDERALMARCGSVHGVDSLADSC
jgi:hypothetical protein